MLKFKTYDGRPLHGEWTCSIKIDGVRVHKTEQGMYSRAGKPLYNIPDFMGSVAEVFCGSFEKTIENTRTKSEKSISPDEVYPLLPWIDPRLLIEVLFDPTAAEINKHFNNAIANGHEGIILRQGDICYKVKPVETYDVIITGIYPGKGKNTGKLGGFITEMGKVGTGLTDYQRELYNDTYYIGMYVYY